MITIYQFDEQRVYTGQSKQIAPSEGAPMGWTRKEPPVLDNGEYAQFGSGQWRVLSEYPHPPIKAPDRITKGQARRQLIRMGITPQMVEDQINQIENDMEKALTMSWWQDETEYERQHPLMTRIGALMGFNEEQIAEAFRLAVLEDDVIVPLVSISTR